LLIFITSETLFFPGESGMSKTAVLNINIDGAARGNPGPAAYAYVIARDGHPVIEEAGCLGSTTNNVAEYTALVKALERAVELGGERIHILSDSELLVKQMNGEYKVKNEQLRDLYEEAKQLCSNFASVTIRHVRRALNSEADGLCNEVLDGVRGAGAAADGPKLKGSSSKASLLEEGVREEAVRCLQSAAHAWSRGDPSIPAPEQVWDQLWSILEENGLLRPRRSR
jgi:ribonuclease HI